MSADIARKLVHRLANDRAFLEQVAAVAMRLTIGEGEKKTQDLKIAGGG